MEGEQERPSKPNSPPSPESEYSRGYEDGTRETLREVVSFIARGHSASEVRLLAETRLDHPGAEWRGGPPRPQVNRRVPLEALLPGRARAEAEPAPAPPSILPGYSYLFFETSPHLAPTFLVEVMRKGMPLVAITRHPESLPPAPDPGRFLALHLVGEGAASEEANLSGVRSVEADTQTLTGIVERFREGRDEPIACYFEALEYLNAEAGFDRTIRLIHWLNTAAQKGRGVLIVSTDPASLSASQLSALRRDFNFVRQGPA